MANAMATGAFMAYVNTVLERVDANTASWGWLNDISAKTGVPRAYLAVGGGTFAFMFLFIGVGAGLVSHLVGFVYPAYASFKAIESPNKEDDTLWLAYWVVFSVFSVLEFFSDTILWVVPFYYTTKMIFLLWCQLPMFKGASFIYKTFLRDLFKRYESEIDNRLARVGTVAGGVLSSTLSNGSAGGASAAEAPAAPTEDARSMYGTKKST